MSFHQDTVILSEYIASQTVVLHSSDFVLFASVSHNSLSSAVTPYCDDNYYEHDWNTKNFKIGHNYLCG